MQNEKLSGKEKHLILEQIKYLHSELCSIQSIFISIISISLAAYGLIIYYAIGLDRNLDGSANIMFVILPYLFLLSFYNVIKYTAKMLGINGYIRYLEELLNYSYRKTLFKWHSYLIYANSFTFVGGIAQFPCYIALTVFVCWKFIENVKLCNFFPHCKFIFISLLVLQIIALFYASLACLSQYYTVRYWCNEIPFSFQDDEWPLPDYRTEQPKFFTFLLAKMDGPHRK